MNYKIWFYQLMFLILGCFKNGLFPCSHKEKHVNYVNCLIEMFFNIVSFARATYLSQVSRESTNVMYAYMCACVYMMNLHVITSHI